MFKAQKDIIYGPSVAKLRGDDVGILRKLVAKYQADFTRMHIDIKLNYMQWSKSELRKKVESYNHYHLN